MPVRAVLLAWVLGAVGALALGACGRGHDPSLAPSRGGQAGGTAVRIEGDDFAGHGTLVVYFGNRAAKAIVVESRWLVTLLTPQGDAVGPVDVQMRFADGTTVEMPEAFTYEEQPGIVLQPDIGQPP